MATDFLTEEELEKVLNSDQWPERYKRMAKAQLVDGVPVEYIAQAMSRPGRPIEAPIIRSAISNMIGPKGAYKMRMVERKQRQDTRHIKGNPAYEKELVKKARARRLLPPKPGTKAFEKEVQQLRSLRKQPLVIAKELGATTDEVYQALPRDRAKREAAGKSEAELRELVRKLREEDRLSWAAIKEKTNIPISRAITLVPAHLRGRIPGKEAVSADKLRKKLIEGRKAGKTFRELAAELGRSASVLSRMCPEEYRGRQPGSWPKKKSSSPNASAKK